MTHLPLKISLILLLILGCKKPEAIEEPGIPCIEINKLDAYSKQTKEWFVSSDALNKVIIDNNGITETLEIVSRNYVKDDASMTDSCGNTYGSFTSSIYYKTSFSPIDIGVVVHGSGIPEEGFYLKIYVSNKNKNYGKGTTYDFVNQKSREGNSRGMVFSEFEVLGNIYKDVLKITFEEITSNTDIKTIYFAKGYGVIQFEKENGNIFKVQ